MTAGRVLVVEDEAIIAEDLKRRLQSFGYTVIDTATTGQDAVVKAAARRPDLVLMDIVLRGDMDGIQAANVMREQLGIPVVYLTSHADSTTVNRAVTTEPFGYILKPLDDRELGITIEMALYRHHAEKKLRDMERWLKTTLNSVGDGLIATDAAGCISLMNPQAERLTGWTATESIGKPLSEVFAICDARSGQPLPLPTTPVLKGEPVTHLDPYVLLQARDQRKIYINDSVAPICDDSGTITGSVLVFRDTTRQVRTEEELRRLHVNLEKQVAERTAELASANKDLESFSYSVSHELRAPLRAIEGYSDMLAERFGVGDDREAAGWLAAIFRNIRRMEGMLEGFLELARVQRFELTKRPIDMHRLVETVVAEMSLQTLDPVPHLEIKPLPDAQGDASMLRQVWSNLISNAVKFSRRTDSPHIEIDGNEADTECVYSIQDNGVGFDMQYADKLFEVFQRLHTPHEFEGTGVGLATVYRIVQRHGGRTWTHAALGQGATFFFALPRHPEAL